MISRLWRMPGLICPSGSGLYWRQWYRQSYREPGIKTDIPHLPYSASFSCLRGVSKIVTHAGPNLSRLRGSCWRPATLPSDGTFLISGHSSWPTVGAGWSNAKAGIMVWGGRETRHNWIVYGAVFCCKQEDIFRIFSCPGWKCNDEQLNMPRAAVSHKHLSVNICL